jgi:hypothetical protein
MIQKMTQEKLLDMLGAGEVALPHTFSMYQMTAKYHYRRVWLRSFVNGEMVIDGWADMDDPVISLWGQVAYWLMAHGGFASTRMVPEPLTVGWGLVCFKDKQVPMGTGMRGSRCG